MKNNEQIKEIFFLKDQKNQLKEHIKNKKTVVISGDYGIGKTKFINDFFINDKVKLLLPNTESYKVKYIDAMHFEISTFLYQIKRLAFFSRKPRNKKNSLDLSYSGKISITLKLISLLWKFNKNFLSIAVGIGILSSFFGSFFSKSSALEGSYWTMLLLIPLLTVFFQIILWFGSIFFSIPSYASLVINRFRKNEKKQL